jgi:hypothetical protein
MHAPLVWSFTGRLCYYYDMGILFFGLTRSIMIESVHCCGWYDYVCDTITTSACTNSYVRDYYTSSPKIKAIKCTYSVQLGCKYIQSFPTVGLNLTEFGFFSCAFVYLITPFRSVHNVLGVAVPQNIQLLRNYISCTFFSWSTFWTKLERSLILESGREKERG